MSPANPSADQIAALNEGEQLQGDSVGFGIAFLAELVSVRMQNFGYSMDDAIQSVGRACELRSEAVGKLREYMHAKH